MGKQVKPNCFRILWHGSKLADRTGKQHGYFEGIKESGSFLLWKANEIGREQARRGRAWEQCLIGRHLTDLELDDARPSRARRSGCSDKRPMVSDCSIQVFQSKSNQRGEKKAWDSNNNDNSSQLSSSADQFQCNSSPPWLASLFIANPRPTCCHTRVPLSDWTRSHRPSGWSQQNWQQQRHRETSN